MAGDQPAILVLLAPAGLFVLIVHDLLPRGALGVREVRHRGQRRDHLRLAARALTGREDSPFFFTFPLIVAGAALVVTPPSRSPSPSPPRSLHPGDRLAGRAPSAERRSRPRRSTSGARSCSPTSRWSSPASSAGPATRRSGCRPIDTLTGLFNRSFFFAAVEREIARSARSGRGFCLLMMDLDELKPVNDRLRPLFGDAVLRGVGGVIRDGSGGSTPPPATAATSSSSCARDRSDRRLRPRREDPARDRRASRWKSPARHPAVGLGRRRRHTRTTAGPATAVDRRRHGAMYRSKRAGKNRVRPRSRSPVRPSRRRPRSGHSVSDPRGRGRPWLGPGERSARRPASRPGRSGRDPRPARRPAPNVGPDLPDRDVLGRRRGRARRASRPRDPRLRLPRLDNPTAAALGGRRRRARGGRGRVRLRLGHGRASTPRSATVLAAGDRVVAPRGLYGTTRALLTGRLRAARGPREFVDMTDLAAVEAALAGAHAGPVRRDDRQPDDRRRRPRRPRRAGPPRSAPLTSSTTRSPRRTSAGRSSSGRTSSWSRRRSTSPATAT